MGMSTISNKQTSQPRKRLTKIRSVKVVSLDRSRLSLKRKKSGLRTQKLIITDDMSKQSPNYMKATSCSNAKRGSKSGDGSTGIRSAKSAKRMLSLKRSRKNTTTTRSRLSCDNEATISGDSYDIPIPYYLGRGEEANTQLVKTGSIKLKTRKSLKFPRRQWSKTRFNKASIFRTDGELPQGNGMEEGTSSYYATKNQKSNSVDAPGLKHVRALWKIPSLRPRRLLIKKQSKSLSCSSTIESNKFVDIDSGRYSKPEVCQYKYCSVHGSLHASSPPLALSSNKKKRRRWKHYPMVEKVQILEVTTKDHADPSDKIGSGMWKLIYNHFLVHKNEVNSEVSEAGGDEDDTYTDLFSYKSKQSPKNNDTNPVYQVAESEKPEFRHIM